jgi:hypothetical protein
MTPTIAIILAVPLALWALAWWDIQRRATMDRVELAKVDRAVDSMRGLEAEWLSHRIFVEERIGKLEKNPATMSATKERMDTLEKAMAELVKQTRAELEEFRARTMTMSSRVDSRRFGARPNG